MSQRDPDPQYSLMALMNQYGRDLRVSLPAKVLKVNFSDGKKTIDVQPLLFDTIINSDNKNEVLKIKPIKDVPVAFLQTEEFMIYLPVKVGDQVELRFQDRSISELLEASGDSPISPRSTRIHNMNDCIAYPTQFKSDSNISDMPDDALLIAHKDQEVELRIKNNGDIVIKGNKVYLGADGGSKPLGDASVIDARISALESWAGTHVHPTAATGPPSPPAAPPPSGSASASSKVFIDA